jgi:hypothetical protein
VEYLTDKTGLISFENGKAKALAVGTANIWAKVTLNGATVETNKVAVKIADNSVNSEKAGSITLDGVLSETGWSKNNAVISKLLDGSSRTISAGFSTVWDRDNLYIGLTVTDPTGKRTDFSKDSMTFYVSPNNSRVNPYSKDDFQIQIFDQGKTVAKGAETVGKNDTVDLSKIKVASSYTDKGYVMEIAVPWTVIGVTPQTGMKMGFDIMAFDNNDGGAILVWSGNGSDWISTVNYGTLTLAETPVVIPPSTNTDQTGSTAGSNAGNTTNSGITADGGNIDLKAGPVVNGVAAVNVPSGDLEKAFENAAADESGDKTVSVKVAEAEGAKGYAVQLPTSALQSSDDSKKIRIDTPVGTAVIPSNALKSTAIQQKAIELCIEKVDRTALSEDLKKQVGDKPVLELNFKVDGKTVAWNNPDAPVTVSLDYKPTEEELEDPEHIVVWYIDGNGKAVAVPNGRYDAATGKVTFTTTHFSKYAVAFVNKTFADIGKYTWAKNQIEVLASKGIIGGTSETTFSPANSITRADFLTMLMKTLGLTQKADSCFDDVKAGDYYYDAVATAKKLGITNGAGDNKFNPKQYISRQDMIVLTEKALKVARGGFAENGTANDLAKFKDNSQVAQYATGSMANFVKAGLIHGSNGNINPRSNTTRAEAAVLLYTIYNMNSVK